jgi:hypothetical protein
MKTSSGVMKDMQGFNKKMSKKSSALKLKQSENTNHFLSQTNASYITQQPAA